MSHWCVDTAQIPSVFLLVLCFHKALEMIAWCPREVCGEVIIHTLFGCFNEIWVERPPTAVIKGIMPILEIRQWLCLLSDQHCVYTLAVRLAPPFVKWPSSNLLRNFFLDFVVEHWFGCRATQPGFAGDIGAIEVWLIDWLIDCVPCSIPTWWIPAFTAFHSILKSVNLSTSCYTVESV